MTIAEYFDIAAFALAVPSLGFAYKTIRDCRELARQLKALLDKNQQQNAYAESQGRRLEELIKALQVQDEKANQLTVMLEGVGKALTTQYVGEFPGYLPYVNKLIERSQKRLRIATTMLGHGSFTDPANWRETVHALSQADGREVDTHVLCVNKALRRKLFQMQYPELFADLAGLVKQKDGELAKKILTFIPREMRIAALTSESLLDMILKEEEIIGAEVFKHAVKAETERFLPFYLWIADESEAIFAFPTHSQVPDRRVDRSVATAFLTKDKDIVRALVQLFDRLEGEFGITAPSSEPPLDENDQPTRGSAPM